MDLNEILVFTKVVQAGSFTAASRELQMPKSTVSRKVSDLEDRLGARLLQRTTRKLSLTDVGQAFYQHSVRAVAEAEEAELSVTRMQEVPRGLLRVTAPLNFGFLAPIVASFLERHPEVQIDLVCADRNVDLIQEGFEVAIRAGPLADSTLIARKLGVLRNVVVATPAFLKAHRAPRTPEDLDGLAFLAFGAGAERTSWKLQNGRKTVSVEVRPRLSVNDFDHLDEAVRAGLGIALLPLHRCVDDLRTGKLVRVLPEWSSPDVPIHAVYPSTHHLSPKVKTFLDHLRGEMTPPPWELGPTP